jgi:hypothetical protein
MSSLELDRLLRKSGIMPVDDKFGRMTPSEIAGLEKRLGESLPDDMKHFLLTYGCSTLPGTASITCKREEQPLSCFFGGKTSTYPIMEDWLSRGKKWPREMIPIADGPFGDRFALVVSGKGKGNVYFCPIHDMELSYEEVDPPSEVDKILASFCKVADSFLDFIRRLKIEPDED